MQAQVGKRQLGDFARDAVAFALLMGLSALLGIGLGQLVILFVRCFIDIN